MPLSARFVPMSVPSGGVIETFANLELPCWRHRATCWGPWALSVIAIPGLSGCRASCRCFDFGEDPEEDPMLSFRGWLP